MRTCRRSAITSAVAPSDTAELRSRASPRAPTVAAETRPRPLGQFRLAAHIRARALAQVALTMVGLLRLRNLEEMLREVVKNGVRTSSRVDHAG